MDIPNRAVTRLRRVSVARDFRPHDVRRTVATQLAEMGTHVPIIEAILGTQPPRLVRTYQVHAPVGEMRAALERAGSHHHRLRLVRAAPQRILRDREHGAGSTLLNNRDRVLAVDSLRSDQHIDYELQPTSSIVSSFCEADGVD